MILGSNRQLLKNVLVKSLERIPAEEEEFLPNFLEPESKGLLMKRTLVLLVVCFCAMLFLTQKGMAQDELTIQEWREDVDYLVARMEVMHPNLYAMISKEVFYQAKEDLKKKLPNLNDAGKIIAISELVAMIQDGHTAFPSGSVDNDKIAIGKVYYLILIENLADGTIISAIDQKYEEALGKRVISVNGIPLEEVLEGVFRTYSGDHQQGKRSVAYSLANSSILEFIGLVNATQEMALGLKDKDDMSSEVVMENPVDTAEANRRISAFFGSNPQSEMVNAIDTSIEPPLYLSRPGDSYWFKYLPDHKVMYVHLLSMNQKSDEDFEQFYARMFAEFDKHNAEKLILDVRNNMGGDHYELPLLKGVIARPQIDTSENLFVITGRRTFSAAQHFVNQFELYTNATFVGEATASKPNFYGAVRRFKLPHTGLMAGVSVAFHQDMDTWDVRAITKPDYIVELSSDDYIHRIDPVLSFILDFEKVEDLPELFRSRLSDAYKTGSTEKMLAEFSRFKDEFAGSKLNLEKQAIEYLNTLIQIRTDIADYGDYLKFLSEEYPDNNIVWWLLGSRFERSGNLEKAKECYRKSVKIYPMNIHAKRALNLLLMNEKEEQKTQ